MATCAHCAAVWGPARGTALAVFFHLACCFFWQRVNLGFFHIEALHVRAQVSDTSRRASPTRRVRIFCIRPRPRVFGGRIRELGSQRLGATRAAFLCDTRTPGGAWRDRARNMRKWLRPTHGANPSVTQVIPYSEHTFSDTNYDICA